MTRNETRTAGAWRSFDRWATFIVPALIALPALLMWANGYGSGATGCCGTPTLPAASTVATPAAVPTAPSIAAVPVPSPVPSAVPAAPPTIDCATIIEGVAVSFDVNKAVVTDEVKRVLDETIRCLGTGRYEIAGHTDASGRASANMRLSLARARAVVRYLESKNVPAGSLTAAGYGATRPLADNATPEGRARNRRIAFTPRAP